LPISLAPITQTINGVPTTYTNLATWANEAIMIGAQRDTTNSAPTALRLFGYINTVRVHGGRLSAADVQANFSAGPSIPPTGVRIVGQPANALTRAEIPITFSIQ